jgi:hypothetical protein
VKADALVLSDGNPVSVWTDFSINGNDATQTGSARPILKTNIVNALPVVRFAFASSQYFTMTSPIVSTVSWTILSVMKPSGAAVQMWSLSNSTTQGQLSPIYNSDGQLYLGASNVLWFGGVGDSTAFHIYTGTSAVELFVDGSSRSLSFIASGSSGDFDRIGSSGASFNDGDLAEVICYDSVLSSGNRGLVESYLSVKYGIPI